MEVKTGELKNNLSRFLKRVAQTGEPITILDRNRPVARLMPLRPPRGKKDTAWEKTRMDLMSRAAKLGIELTMTESRPKPIRPKPSRSQGIAPTLAPDGRDDIETVVRMRREKDY